MSNKLTLRMEQEITHLRLRMGKSLQRESPKKENPNNKKNKLERDCRETHRKIGFRFKRNSSTCQYFKENENKTQEHDENRLKEENEYHISSRI